MASRKHFRSQLSWLAKSPPHSWIHNTKYSISRHNPAIYLLCTPHGPITIHEEYWCWVFAATKNYSLASRMVYGKSKLRPTSLAKCLKRVDDLLEMDSNGVIQLRMGPWKYFGYDVGYPYRFENTEIVDYYGRKS